VRYLPHRLAATSDPTSIWDRHWRGEGGTVPCLSRRRRRIRQAIGQEIAWSGGGDLESGDAESEGGDSSVSLCWIGIGWVRPVLASRCARFLGVGRLGWWPLCPAHAVRGLRVWPAVLIEAVFFLEISNCHPFFFSLQTKIAFFSVPLANRSSNTTLLLPMNFAKEKLPKKTPYLNSPRLRPTPP
jgi:hypothetical protein